MALTASTMVDLGSSAPEFALPNVAGGTATLSSSRGSTGTLVAFLCRHCPYVRHIEREIAGLAADAASRGISFVAIGSNDADAYPDDAPDSLRTYASELGWTFPFLHDPTQAVAKAYGAACTPDFFLFDARDRLFYRGQLDASRPGNKIPVTGSDLRFAMERLFRKETPPSDQRPSMGCNIKWKPGNEPAYFQKRSR